MAGRAQLVCLALICAVLLVGCQKGAKIEKEKIVLSPTEAKKAQLLERIDSKFEDPGAHFELGQLYQAERRWTQAEYEYNTALSFDPAHRPAQASIVKVLLDSGSKATAKITADIYMSQVSASADESLLLAVEFQKRDLDEYALSCYRQALRKAPNSAMINRHLGYYYLGKGNDERAKEHLSRSFRLNPHQPDIAQELGRLGVVVEIPKQTSLLEKILKRSETEKKP
ncbi:MAG: hypothetical protein ACYS0I_03640 [Planctomycetota bacterium]|jgi:tetratricopeptide (TPR) repeat protein